MKDSERIETVLQEFNTQITRSVGSEEVDNSLINHAIVEGTRIREAKEFFWNNLIFIVCGLLVFTVLGYIITVGYVTVILVIQILMVILCPLIIPLVIHKQLKGGIS